MNFQFRYYAHLIISEMTSVILTLTANLSLMYTTVKSKPCIQYQSNWTCVSGVTYKILKCHITTCTNSAYHTSAVLRDIH